MKLNQGRWKTNNQEMQPEKKSQITLIQHQGIITCVQMSTTSTGDHWWWNRSHFYFNNLPNKTLSECQFILCIYWLHKPAHFLHTLLFLILVKFVHLKKILHVNFTQQFYKKNAHRDAYAHIYLVHLLLH